MQMYTSTSDTYPTSRHESITTDCNILIESLMTVVYLGYRPHLSP